MHLLCCHQERWVDSSSDVAAAGTNLNHPEETYTPTSDCPASFALSEVPSASMAHRPQVPLASYSPVDRLVDDLLEDIFMLVCATDFSAGMRWITDETDPLPPPLPDRWPLPFMQLWMAVYLSSICRRWRRIAHSCSRLWTRLALPWLGSRHDTYSKLLLNVTTAFLHHSLDQPLHVYLVTIDRSPPSLRTEQPYWRSMALVWENSYRWSSFDIIRRRNYPPFPILWPIPPYSPHITSATIDDSLAFQWISAQPSPVMLCKSLSLNMSYFVMYPWSSNTFSNITSLNVQLIMDGDMTQGWRRGRTLHNTMSLLTTMPSLESLTIELPNNAPSNVFLPPLMPPAPLLPPILLSNLTSLNLLGYEPRGPHFAPYLQSFSFPALSHLHIQEPMPETLPEDIRRSGCVLHSFHFTVRPDESHLPLRPSLLARLGSVVSLSIDTYGSYRCLMIARQLCDTTLLPSLTSLVFGFFYNHPILSLPMSFDYASNVLPFLTARSNSLRYFSADLAADSDAFSVAEVRSALLELPMSVFVYIHCDDNWSHEMVDTRVTV